MTPAPALVVALLALAGLGLPVALGWLPAGALVVFALGLLVVAWLDALQLRRLPTPRVSREVASTVPVGLEREVALRLRHDAATPLRVDVHDLHPGAWPVCMLPQRVSVAPQRELRLSYRLTPPERGRFEFGGCMLRLHSPLRLWWQQRCAAASQTLHVYPNFAPLAKLALVGAEQASRVIGAHLKRRRGEGTEFQQLREYRLGDSMRQVDWKATQRMRKLISREYQDERNQQVMLLLDTGRRLLARDGLLSHFDHVLNAALMVAWIALRQGDAVGLLAAGGDGRFVAPRRGLATIDVLLNALFDLKPSAVATDYLDAVATLAARQPRRCLVLLLTNARDEDVEDLLAAVRQLQRRHLVCVASLREDVVAQGLQRPVRDLDDAVHLGAMAQYIEQRERVHAALRAQRADVLDVTCAQLPAALVSHYLAMKRSARL